MTESPMLGFGLEFEDLYRRDGLVRLDGAFVDVLKARNPELHNRLMARARAAPGAASRWQGRIRSDRRARARSRGFHRRAVRHRGEMNALKARHDALAPLYGVKRLFVQRRAAKKYKPEQAAAFDGAGAARASSSRCIGGAFTELRFAEAVDALDEGRGRARRRRSSSPRATPPGRRTRRRAAQRHGRRAVQGAAQGRPAPPGAGRDRGASTASRCSSCRGASPRRATASR